MNDLRGKWEGNNVKKLVKMFSCERGEQRWQLTIAGEQASVGFFLRRDSWVGLIQRARIQRKEREYENSGKGEDVM